MAWVGFHLFTYIHVDIHPCKTPLAQTQSIKPCPGISHCARHEGTCTKSFLCICQPYTQTRNSVCSPGQERINVPVILVSRTQYSVPNIFSEIATSLSLDFFSLKYSVGERFKFQFSSHEFLSNLLGLQFPHLWNRKGKAFCHSWIYLSSDKFHIIYDCFPDVEFLLWCVCGKGNVNSGRPILCCHLAFIFGLVLGQNSSHTFCYCCC